MVEKGQVYVSAKTLPSGEPRRIVVVYVPHYYNGKVGVATLTEGGRKLRRRQMDIHSLHQSGTTRDGNPRLNGYYLEGS